MNQIDKLNVKLIEVGDGLLKRETPSNEELMIKLNEAIGVINVLVKAHEDNKPNPFLPRNSNSQGMYDW